MATVNQVFPTAPMGRRIVRTMIISVGMLVATEVFYAVFFSSRVPVWVPGPARAAIYLGPMAGLLVVVPLFLIERARTARFGIEENCLVLGKKRYPLAGLVGVERDSNVLTWAIKLGGNSGVGAVRGRFWSKRVGKFEAFLTGSENAVVLRWPNRTVAVSPADPEFFITCARSAAGLK